MTLHLEINVEDAHIQIPYMKFLSVRSDICRRLPSDFNSRWTPLPLTIQFPLLGLTRDFPPRLDSAHAKRTKRELAVQVFHVSQGRVSFGVTLLYSF